MQFGSWEADFRATAEGRAGTLRWSDEIYRIAGFELGTVRGVDRTLLCEFVHPEDRVGRPRGRCARGTQPDGLLDPAALVRPTGEIRIVHETGHLFFDNVGQLTC